MFLIFAAAALIVTDAVALLALVGSWWMLGVAFAVHVAMTALVTLTIVGAMNGRGFAISDSRKTPQEPRLGSQPQARSEAVTAL
jgi:membrane protein implicated in regulation of membrane protease activity